MFAFNDDEIAALDADTQNISLHFHLATEPKPVRVWLGAGPVKVGDELLDLDGAVYKGLGQWPSIPAFKALMMGRADRLDIPLSGVDDEIASKFAGESNQVRGKKARIGFALWHPKNWKTVGQIHWVRTGIVDQVANERVAAQKDQPATNMIMLSIGSLSTGTRRGRYAYMTPQDQQARSPGDRYCERTPRLSYLQQKKWPL